jgi:hypothetical protein
MGMAANLLISLVLRFTVSPVASPISDFPPAVPPCPRCVVLQVPVDGVTRMPDALNGIRVVVEGSADSAAVARALDEIARRGGVPGLVVPAAAPDPQDGLLAPSALTRAAFVLLDMRGSDGTPEALAFRARRWLTAARAAAPESRLGVEADSHVLAVLVERGLNAYVDFFVGAAEETTAVPVPAWRRETAPENAADLLRPGGVTAPADVIVRVPFDAGGAGRIVNDVVRAAGMLREGLAPSVITARCGDEPGDAYFDPASLGTVVWFQRCPAGAPVTTVPAAAVVERVDLSSGEAIVRFEAEPGRVAEGVSVTADRRLSVQEIVARHQAAVARQTSRVQSVISAGTLAVTFEAPGFVAPVAVSSDAMIYTSAAATEIAQENIRVNGVRFNGRAMPRLPLIEPERVASPPLTITLTDKYHYTLRGEETLGDRHCYVIAFEPLSRNETLFSGTAWIDRSDFGLVRVSATQTGLRGAVVSSEQDDRYARLEDGTWLLTHSDTRQLYEGAAFRTPIHRVLDLDRFEVNAADFDERRTAAYRSDAVILRDTPTGYRYLEPAARSREDGRAERQLAPAATRIRTLAFGAIVDPNISRPLPFAGISYADFNLFGTGTQFTGFFGGTYGQLAFSTPAVGRTKWQLAGRAFAIASSYNDRAFEEGIEQYDQNLRQRPAHVSVSALRPFRGRFAFRAGYELDYTRLTRGDTTADDFVVPADQVVHGVRLSLEGQRDGWTAALWWNPGLRAGWHPWGPAGAEGFDPGQRDFQRYGASLSRSSVVSPRLIVRTELEYMAGRDLDRFSRYAFGAFDNRLHGYPAALIRYDRGGVVRTSAAWALSRLTRLDLFADAATVHDPAFGRGLKTFAGFGAAAEAPVPFGMLAAVEWGYGVQGIDSNGARGTHVVRVTAYKIF